MEDLHDVLVAHSQGSQRARSSSNSNAAPALDAPSAAARRACGGAPRTSFLYSSRGPSTSTAAAPPAAAAAAAAVVNANEAPSSPPPPPGNVTSSLSLLVSSASPSQPPLPSVSAMPSEQSTAAFVVVSSSSSSSSGSMEELQPATLRGEAPPAVTTDSLPAASAAAPRLAPAPPLSPPPPAIPACFSAMGRMDASQIRAATFPIDQPLLLQAGAGSGKTQTMAARIVFLLQSGVPPRSILGVCFTRQAAETLRARVEAVLPPELANQSRLLQLKTLHGFGLQCLRRFNTNSPYMHAVDARKQREIAKYVVADKALMDKSADAVMDLVTYVNSVKAKKVPPIQQCDPSVQAPYLFPFYEKRLHDELGDVDFGDMQQLFYQMIRPVPATDGSAANTTATVAPPPAQDGGAVSNGAVAPSQSTAPSPQQQRLVPSRVCADLRALYTHIIVDEFQDLNEVQMEILALLAGDECRVTCVGDPNQCIYTWRGALPKIFEVWRRRFPQTTVLTLAMNYRSDAPIVAAANQLVQAQQQAFHHREDRDLTLVHCETDDDEHDAVPFFIHEVLKKNDANLLYSDIAILCRTRRRTMLYLEILRAHRIPAVELKSHSVNRLPSMRSLQALLGLCLAPHTAEGNGDVQMVLTCSPAFHLPPGVLKKVFLALESVCRERRNAEAERIRAWRHSIAADAGSAGGLNAARPGSPYVTAAGPAEEIGTQPETYSYFGVLQDLVYHNFSKDLFPKLELSKRAQKSVRQMVQLIAHARTMLAQPSSDVEQLLRDVLREGGYESESTYAATEAGGRQSGQKRTRHGGAATQRRVGESLAHDTAASLSGHGSPSQQLPHTQQTTTAAHHHPHPYRASSPSWSAVTAVLGDDDLLPPEEEAAVWAEQHMTLSELILRTYHTVHETLQLEVAEHLRLQQQGITATTTATTAAAAPGAGGGAAAVDDEVAATAGRGDDSDDHHHGAGHSNSNSRSVASARGTAMQSMCPPTALLQRLLDEFVSLLGSDDYGPMQSPAKAPGAVDHRPVGTVRWEGQVTVGTVHSAKGMEWPVVLVPGCWVGEFPATSDLEEKRVFYVAMSRAMRQLIFFTAAEAAGSEPISYSMAKKRSQGIGSWSDACSQVSGAGKTGPYDPSPFLSAISSSLVHLDYATMKKDNLRSLGYI